MTVSVVRGRANAEELAAVLLALRRTPHVDDPYLAWRRGREAALRRHPHEPAQMTERPGG